MTEEELTRERNVFMGGFLGLTVVIFSFLLYREVVLPVSIFWILAVLLTGSYIYFACRLSRFLNQQGWLTLLYCLLPLLSFWGIALAFFGLLFSVRRTRYRIIVSNPEVITGEE